MHAHSSRRQPKVVFQRYSKALLTQHFNVEGGDIVVNNPSWNRSRYSLRKSFSGQFDRQLLSCRNSYLVSILSTRGFDGKIHRSLPSVSDRSFLCFLGRYVCLSNVTSRVYNIIGLCIIHMKHKKMSSIGCQKRYSTHRTGKLMRAIFSDHGSFHS